MAASFWRNMGRAPCLMEMGALVREAEMLAADEESNGCEEVWEV